MTQLSPLFTWRSAVTTSPELSATAKHVALTMTMWMSELGNSCFPGIRTLAAASSRSTRTVQRALHELAGKDYLRIEFGTGRGHTNRYVATIPACDTRTTPAFSEVTERVTPGPPLAREEEGRKPANLTPFSEERVTNTTRKGDTRTTNHVITTPVKPKDSPRVASLSENGASSTSTPEVAHVESDATSTTWEGFAKVLQTLDELGLAGMDDPAYWQRIDQLTDGSRVYYLDELRKYALWLESAPPGKTRKDRKRQFANWVRKELARDDYRAKVRLLEGRA